MTYKNLLNDWVNNMDVNTQREICIQFGLFEPSVPKNIVTIGGHLVEDFKILENPIVMQQSENHIYSGMLTAPMVNNEIKRIFTTWDKFGHVNNPSRSDCYIDISKFN